MRTKLAGQKLKKHPTPNHYPKRQSHKSLSILWGNLSLRSTRTNYDKLKKLHAN